MLRRVLLSMWLLGGPAQAAAPQAGAEAAYQEARSGYYSLKGDANRRKFRHNWLAVAKKFEAVALKYPKSERAPDALFTAAELFNELSRISRLDEDLRAATENYRRLLEGHPRHRLSDDGALHLARIHAERRDDPGAAKKVLKATLEKNAKGDQAAAMKSLLASLPADPEPPKVPPSPPKPKLATRSVRELSQAAARAQSRTARAAPERPLGEDLDAPEPSAEEPLSETPEAVSALQLDQGGSGDEPAPAALPTETEPAAQAALSFPTLSELQEKLRHVRVGEHGPLRDDRVAKERLRRVARDRKQSELTLAEQLGLKIRRVVIDAGHGGHDSGAVGRQGLREKDVTLSIALKVAKQLEQAGLEVLLTRDDDTFVKLEDRAKLANDARGDLFISIHCNSAPTRKLRGIETYTLNTSADRYSIRLAARENASSEKSVSDLQFILADLATKANTEESSRLARAVQQRMVGTLRPKYAGIRDLGQKEALFYVLLGARMPAILVETSFLSHPDEERLLASRAYQDDIALAISKAVEDFAGARERLAQVD